MGLTTNQKTFKYKVEVKEHHTDGETIINTYRFKTTKDITTKFNIPRNSIYYIMNDKVKSKDNCKYKDYKIYKISEPAFVIYKYET